MKTKYTPGPWVATGTTVSEQASYGTGNRVVAECGQSTNGETDLANARLIAAAPELLEALRSLHRFVHDQVGMGLVPESIDSAVCAAIAKAEGSDE